MSQDDLAIAEAFIVAVRSLYEEKCSSFEAQRRIDTRLLSALLQNCARDSDQASIDDAGYLAVLGLSPKGRNAASVWVELLEKFNSRDSWWRDSVEMLLSEGPLARRILRAVGGDFRREHLREVYATLCTCLNANRRFSA